MVSQVKSKSAKNSIKYSDVSIFCEDGFTVPTNMFLLSSLSRWLYTLVMDQSDHDEVVIILPDIQSQNIINLLQTVENSIEENTLRNIVTQKPDVILPWNQIFSVKDQGKELYDINGMLDLKNKNNISLEKVETNSKKEKGEKQNSELLTNEYSDMQPIQSKHILNEIKSYVNMSNLSYQLKTSQKDEEENTIVKSTENEQKNCNSLLDTIELEIEQNIVNKKEAKENIVFELQKFNKFKENIKLSCDHCNYICLTNRSLRKHMKSHHGDSMVQYKCDDCDRRFKQSNSLKTHKESQHLGIRYSCDECDISLTQKIHLREHKKYVHRLKNSIHKEYICDQCEFKAIRKGCLKRHIKNKHNGVRVPCNQCTFKAASKMTLKTHIESKHENIQYYCDQCDYKVSKKSCIKTHKDIHHKGIRHYCDKCEYSAGRTGDLNRHILKNH